MESPYELLIVNLTNQFFSLQKQIETLMATQQEVAQKLDAATTQLNGLTSQVQVLKDAANSNPGEAIADLNDKADALVAGVQSLANVLAGSASVTPAPVDTTGAPAVDENGNPVDTTGGVPSL